MGTPTPIKNGARTATRDSAVRGITAEPPKGWAAPDTAERIAAFAKAMGWDVQSRWDWSNDNKLRLWVEMGRLLYPGENTQAKGDRWLYKLVWEEIREKDRPNAHFNRMRLTHNRALTPSTGKWQDGPSLKLISDLIGRHPKPVRAVVSVPVVKIKADKAKIG